MHITHETTPGTYLPAPGNSKHITSGAQSIISLILRMSTSVEANNHNH